MTQKLQKQLKPLIYSTIEKLKSKEFKKDPIGGEHFSKITSLMSSAYKRHGLILEYSFLNLLKNNQNYDTWEDKEFKVSRPADDLASSFIENPLEVYNTETSYSTHRAVRTLQIDLITYNKRTKELSAYEIKRSNGSHDAGKKRQILRDILCVQVLLKSYGESKNFEVKSARSYIINYYGIRDIVKPFSIINTELDEHFGFSVYRQIEEINEIYRKKLFEILSR